MRYFIGGIGIALAAFLTVIGINRGPQANTLIWSIAIIYFAICLLYFLAKRAISSSRKARLIQYEESYNNQIIAELHALKRQAAEHEKQKTSMREIQDALNRQKEGRRNYI